MYEIAEWIVITTFEFLTILTISCVSFIKYLIEKIECDNYRVLLLYARVMQVSCAIVWKNVFVYYVRPKILSMQFTPTDPGTTMFYDNYTLYFTTMTSLINDITMQQSIFFVWHCFYMYVCICVFYLYFVLYVHAKNTTVLRKKIKMKYASKEIVCSLLFILENCTCTLLFICTVQTSIWFVCLCLCISSYVEEYPNRNTHITLLYTCFK